MTAWIRRTHRWLSIVFTILVAGNFAAMSVARHVPPALTYAPLPPLFLMLATGLFLFARPYAVRRAT